MGNYNDFYGDYDDFDREDRENCNDNHDEQSHVHEVTGSVRIVEFGDEAHNHRFEGTTGEAIRVPGGHIHKFRARTDFYEGHYHPIYVKTDIDVCVGEGDDARHVHFIDGKTEVVEGHCHEFIDATLIDNPIGEKNRRK